MVFQYFQHAFWKHINHFIKDSFNKHHSEFKTKDGFRSKLILFIDLARSVPPKIHKIVTCTGFNHWRIAQLCTLTSSHKAGTLSSLHCSLLVLQKYFKNILWSPWFRNSIIKTLNKNMKLHSYTYCTWYKTKQAQLDHMASTFSAQNWHSLFI